MMDFNLAGVRQLKRRAANCFGFTLVELLIAMTATLLLMAALAKSFGMIGRSIKTGRSQVTLSSKLRNLSFRLRHDVRARTVDANPPMSSVTGQGYFMIYEGPFTEQTFGLYGDCPERRLPDGTKVYPYTDRDAPVGTAVADTRFTDATLDLSPTYRKHSRYGDFDDYIAFTAEASGDNWFAGKVPAYLVNDTAPDPMAPTVIRSKYAEIIIWASPRWDVDSSNNLVLAPHPIGMPNYKDQDGNLVPDEIVLHQRILLIRPDLNVKITQNHPQFPIFGYETDVLRPSVPSGGNAMTTHPARIPAALESIYPIGIPNPASAQMPIPGAYYPSYINANSDTNNQQMLNSNWLVGMTPLHQFFDLSLRRIVNPNTGEPTPYVAANSLQDLVQPHNRFAHVRYPGQFMGRGVYGGIDNATSMPLLAVASNPAIFTWQGLIDPRAETPVSTVPAWFPQSHPFSFTRNGAGSGSSCGLFNGWLLPHFELGDPNPVDTASNDHWQRGYLATADNRWDRTGEDVMESNILAFDIRVFDPSAPVFLSSGLDGEPGKKGVDDDNSGGTNASDITATFGIQASSELGAVGSDDEIVTCNDLAIYALINTNILDPNLPATFNPMNAAAYSQQMIASHGSFVDLMYPYLAGGPLQERTSQAIGTISGATVICTPRSTNTSQTTTFSNLFNYMQSSFSAYPIPHASLSSLKRSGKLVHNGTMGDIWFMQPTYDTWTDGYESDGFDQTQSLNGSITGQAGTTWVLNTQLGLAKTPRLTSTTSPNLQIDTGLIDPSSPETSPPFAASLPAIEIVVRMDDPSNGEMMQFNIIEMTR